jgi:hypothetical protein
MSNIIRFFYSRQLAPMNVIHIFIEVFWKKELEERSKVRAIFYLNKRLISEQ